MTDTHYLTCAETAKLVRKSLKEAFPGIKFSVRSHTYSMGASIYVHWTDGPTAKEVKGVVGAFESATFDGMTDYQGGKCHQFNGKPVHFGSHWVSETRDISDGFLANLRRAFAQMDEHQRFELMKSTDAQRRLTPFERPDSYMIDADLSDFGDHAETIFLTMTESISLCPSKGSPTADSAVIVRTY